MEIRKDFDSISIDEAYEMFQEWPACPQKLEMTEPAALRPSKVRDELRAAIRGIENNGLSLVVDLTGEKPLLRSREESEPEAVPETIPEVEPVLTPDEIFNRGLAAIVSDIKTKRRERKQLLTSDLNVDLWKGVPQDARPLPRVAPWPPPKPRLADRWRMYREDRREKRYYTEPRKALYGAIGAVAAIGLVFGVSFLAASSVPHESAPREATPAVALNVHEAPTTTTTTTEATTTTTTTTVKQTMPQLTQEEAKAVITISAARHSVEVAHPEFTQSQVDVYFMGAMDFAARVQGGSSTTS